MKPRKTLSIYVLLVGVMGLSIVGGILVFQVFSASVKTQLTADQIAAVKPIDGTINEAVVNNLQQRMVVAESELIFFTTPAPTPVASPSGGQGAPAVLQPSGQGAPVATESGEIITEAPEATPAALTE